MSDGKQDSGDELKRVPVLLPGDVATPASLPGMDSGIKEAKLLGGNLTSDQIAAKAANSEHNRTERFRDNFETVALCGMWLFAMMIFLAGLAWFYHVILPEKWHWLSSEAVARLQNILTGGVVAAVAGGHLKRRMG